MLLELFGVAGDERDADVVLVKAIGAIVAIAGFVSAYLTARNSSRVNELVQHIAECQSDRDECRERCDRLEAESKQRDERDRLALQAQIDESKRDRERLQEELNKLRAAATTAPPTTGTK